MALQEMLWLLLPFLTTTLAPLLWILSSVLTSNHISPHNHSTQLRTPPTTLHTQNSQHLPKHQPTLPNPPPSPTPPTDRSPSSHSSQNDQPVPHTPLPKCPS
ncbi:hypothetical protein L596_019106 [Steinernema carpocapsae]|uniref:Uncharacterized protein n=1 Tax=Steinernema carpocapsae TaxID=34508 RepID=A0A4U5N791_STECR|nr:hypothetical protein L596_019106 [Steinernema carpocapsae]